MSAVFRPTHFFPRANVSSPDNLGRPLTPRHGVPPSPVDILTDPMGAG